MKLLGKLNDLGVVMGLLPASDRSLPSGAPLEEHIDRHGDTKLANRDLHIPLNNLVVWDFSHPQRQSHTRPTESQLGASVKGLQTLTASERKITCIKLTARTAPAAQTGAEAVAPDITSAPSPDWPDTP